MALTGLRDKMNTEKKLEVAERLLKNKEVSSNSWSDYLLEIGEIERNAGHLGPAYLEPEFDEDGHAGRYDRGTFVPWEAEMDYSLKDGLQAHIPTMAREGRIHKKYKKRIENARDRYGWTKYFEQHPEQDWRQIQI